MVVRQSMRVIFIGLGIGVVGALLTSRLLTRLLFKTPATDLLTFVGVAVVLLTVLSQPVTCRRAASPG